MSDVPLYLVTADRKRIRVLPWEEQREIYWRVRLAGEWMEIG